MTDYTDLSRVLVLGPKIGRRPLWEVELDVGYSGTGARPVVDKVPALATLLRSDRTTKVGLPSGSETLHRPLLMRAEIATEAQPKLWLSDGSRRISVRIGELPEAKDGGSFWLAPHTAQWPKQVIPNEIRVPPMNLVEGGLRFGVLLKDPQLTHYLQLKSIGNAEWELFGGLLIKSVKDSKKRECLPVRFTATGIEFAIQLPDPSYDFKKLRKDDDTGIFNAVVCLERLSDREGFTLRLLDSPPVSAIEARLAAALTGLYGAGAPLSMRFNTQPKVPSLSWHLEEKKGKHGRYLRFQGTRNVAGTRPMWRNWLASLDAQAMNVRMVTPTSAGQLDSTAELALKQVVLERVTERGKDGLRLQLNAPQLPMQQKSSSAVPRPTVDLVFGKDVTTSRLESLGITVDLYSPLELLTAAATAARALAPGQTLPFVFLPVTGGWLQLPVPKPLREDEPQRRLGRPAETEAGNDDQSVTPVPPVLAETIPSELGTLGGRLIVASRERRTIELESAQHAAVTVHWTVQGGAEWTTANLKAWHASGRINGLLFAALGSPTVEEALPTLANGSVDTLDLPLQFGELRASSGQFWNGRFDLSPGDSEKKQPERWTLWLPQLQERHEPRPLAWLRDARRPLISSAALTQTTLSSPLPSPSRQLLPMQLADASLTLEVSKKDQSIPELQFREASWLDDSFSNIGYAADGHLPEDADTLMSLVIPTLPGIEFLPNKPVPGRNLGLHASLRFDLPQLDPLFASSSVDRGEQSVESRSEAATALFPDRLRGIWRQQRLRLDLARTDAARASSWHKTDAPLATTRVETLIEPYIWQAAFAVATGVAAGELAGLPLGSYVLGGTEANPRRYALDSALLHLDADPLQFEISGNALQESSTGMVPVTGFAAPLFESDQDWWQDSRGLRLKRCADTYDRFSVRAAHVLSRSSGRSEGFLLTTLTPIELDLSLALPACSATIKQGLALHVRDLFVRLQDGAYRFDNNKQEEGLATEQAMAPEAIAESLHEWRLYQLKAEGASTDRYELCFGALGFVPLRLRELVLSKAGDNPRVLKLVMLGKIGLASVQVPDKTQAFGSEFAYTTADVVELVVEPSGDSYTGRLRTKDEKTAPTINLDIEVKLPEGSGSSGSRVALSFGAEQATLTAPLFGRVQSLKGQVIMTSQESLHSLRFESSVIPQDAESAVRLEKVVLEVRPANSGWVAAIIPVWGLKIGAHGVTLFEAGERLEKAPGAQYPILTRWWRCLGLDEQGAVSALHIDHRTGLIRLMLDGAMVSDTAAPIAGIVPANTKWSVQGLVMASAIGSAGRPIHAEIRGCAIDLDNSPLGLELLLEAKQHDEAALHIHWRRHDTSVVSWPLSLNVTDRKDWLARTLTVGHPQRLLKHEVTFHLVGQPVPVDALRWSGEALCLHKPWRLLATTRHRLWWHDEQTAKTTELTWQTLDHVVIQPIRCLANPEHHSFAPRYVHGLYRGRDDSPNVPHPGIVPSTMASAGFGDRHLLEILRRPQDAQAEVLVIIGGAATMFEHQAGQALAAVIPWMLLPAQPARAGEQPAPAQAAVRAPHALSGLQSALKPEIQWRIAAADAESCRPIPLAPTPVATTLRLGHAAVAITAALDRTALTRDGDWIADIAEQAFIEPVGRDIGALGSSEVLYFPRAALTLQAVWNTSSKAGQTLSLNAKVVVVDETFRTLRVAVSAAIHPDEEKKGAALVALSVLDAKEVATAFDSVNRSTAVADRIAYRDQGLRASPDAIGLMLRTMTTDGIRWEPIDLAPPLDDFGAPARELSPATTWPASPARSWPSGEGVAGLAHLAPAVGKESPVVSSIAGLSARCLAVGWPAWAPGVAGTAAEPANEPGSPQALYLSYEDHVVFRSSTNSAEFRGPAADHLTVRSQRPRVPFASQVRKALTGLGATSFATILPPVIERSLIGARPGTFYASALSLTVPTRPDDVLAFDSLHPRFGRPANSSPVIAHQLRFPRAPALPRVDKKDFAVTRRTFVSLADHANNDSLEQLHAHKGYVAVFREQQRERDWRFTLSTPTQPSSEWDGKLEIFIDYRISKPLSDPGEKQDDQNRQFLEEIGLLPQPRIKLLIGLVTVELKHDQNSPKIGADRIIFSLGLDAERLATVRSELARRSADTSLMLALTLEPAPTAQRCSRQILLRLLPGAEPSPQLPVGIGSAVFGDPAYDRQLGSATQSDSKVQPAGDRYLLAADRPEYDANSTVYFACMYLDASGVAQHSDATLTVEMHRLPHREAGVSAPAPEQLLLEVQPQLGRPFAVPLNTTTTVGKAATRWVPGDVLKIVASFGRGDTLPTKLEVSLRIVRAPVIAPPPAIYSVIGISEDNRVSTVPLHACAPLPQLIEFPDLIGGLTKGYVARRALFIWSWATVEELPHRITLVKYDRSGGAQLPGVNSDFVELLEAIASD